MYCVTRQKYAKGSDFELEFVAIFGGLLFFLLVTIFLAFFSWALLALVLCSVHESPYQNVFGLCFWTNC